MVIVALLAVSHSSHTVHQVFRKQVARFARPFEARPVDPVIREVFRQLAETSGTASTSGWVAPSATLPPLLLLWRAAQRKVLPGRCPPNPRARGRDPQRHSAAKDVPEGED